MGIDRDSYSNWERAESFPQPKNLEKLAVFYKVSVSDLLTDKIVSPNIKKNIDTPDAEALQMPDANPGGSNMQELVRMIGDQMEGRMRNMEERIKQLEQRYDRVVGKTLEQWVKESYEEIKKDGNQ